MNWSDGRQAYNEDRRSPRYRSLGHRGRASPRKGENRRAASFDQLGKLLLRSLAFHRNTTYDLTSSRLVKKWGAECQNAAPNLYNKLNSQYSSFFYEAENRMVGWSSILNKYRIKP
jgi:hypothetical protein